MRYKGVDKKDMEQNFKINIVNFLNETELWYKRVWEKVGCK